MAWIKLDHTTPDKPEVIRMASRLRLDSDAVIGKLARVWIWADQQSVDGNAVPVTFAFLDRLTGKRGFAQAMQEAGWLTGNEGSLTFPEFTRHNGETAKARAQTNRRVAEHRQRHGNTITVTPPPPHVTSSPLRKPLPEKIREEEIDSLSLPPAPTGRQAPRVKVRPDGWPTTEAQAREMAEQAGCDPDSAATYWLHCDALQEWPPGPFASVIKAKQGWQRQDLADKLKVEEKRAGLRSEATTTAKSAAHEKHSTPGKHGF